MALGATYNDLHCPTRVYRTATGTLIGLGGNGLCALEAIYPNIQEKIK
jgi:hypothetical protein